MPMYEYQCRSCQQRFEELHKSMDAELPACPHCGSRKVEKQFSVFAAHQPAPAPVAAPVGGCGNCGSAGGDCPWADN
ncbi:MAG: hypothetical protein HJJLKODD_01188 [Phycisphaerae bacterium]|nr:hypothetical protein [Phycisphaerae bacterium]